MSRSWVYLFKPIKIVTPLIIVHQMPIVYFRPKIEQKPNAMKTRIIIPALVILLVSACSPTVKVTSDYDKQVDFSTYKTYTFAPESMNLPINELNQKRILSSIETELAAKNLSKTESGDLLVDVRITAKERQESTAYTSGGYGYGGYRWGGGMSTTSISTQTYVDGTLIITLVDAAKKEMVWQGVGVKTIDTDATPEQREKNITTAVAAILKNYPPVVKKL